MKRTSAIVENHLSKMFQISGILMTFLISGKPVKNEGLLSLAQAVYSPYVAYISKYAQYAQAYLSQQLSLLQCSKADLMDTVQSLGQSIPRVISVAVEADKMCLLFTEGCGYCGLIKALKVSTNCMPHYILQGMTIFSLTRSQKIFATGVL
jgi:hypothetical protein